MNTYINYILLFLLISCEGKSQKSHTAFFQFSIEKSSYDFKKPKEVLLGKELKEISGLGYNKENKTIYCNNDEEGTVFEISVETGKIINRYSFSGKGDYEGLEKIKEQIAVVKNNGNIYLFNNVTNESKKIKTPLSAKNDIEGLSYNETTNQLLIACKGKSIKKHNKGKVIYTYDLTKEKFNLKPLLDIKKKKITSFLYEKRGELGKKHLKKMKKRITSFAPSGIAIHPKTKELFVISARGSMLLRITEESEIKEVVFFNELENPQPEGICFDTDANLYISTEGKFGKAKLFTYSNQLKE